MRKSITTILSLIILLGVAGCSRKKENSKNMEQIQKEEGIPVRVEEVMPTTFNQAYNYNATLTGIEESVVKSMVSDVVVNINAKVGDYVKKDQIIMTFPMDTPAAQYIQASTAFQNTRTTYERMQRLFTQGAISKQDIDNVETGYKVAEANLNNSRNMIYIKAPINGYLTAINVNQGDKVDNGNDLFTVSNTSKYKAVLWIPDTDIQVIKKGMKVSAKWNEETLNGNVSTIAMAMDQNKKAFRVEVVFNSKPKNVASGVTVDVGINTETIPNAIVAQRSSLVDTGGKLFAWIVVNNKAVKKEIQPGHNNGIDYEIKSGLSQGDMLITEGLNMVYEGCLVKVIQ